MGALWRFFGGSRDRGGECAPVGGSRVVACNDVGRKDTVVDVGADELHSALAATLGKLGERFEAEKGEKGDMGELPDAMVAYGAKPSADVMRASDPGHEGAE